VASGTLDIELRRLRESQEGSGRFEHVLEQARLEPARTAALICDMWDRHWCRGATRRVAEMAGRMNDFVSALRGRGVLVVHCPSDTMESYAGHPGRELALRAPPTDVSDRGIASRISTAAGPLPIEDHDGGCDCTPKCRCARPFPWKRQIAALEIAEGDAIGDREEVLRLLAARGIRRALIMGVHTNMCVLGRTFGIRNLVDKDYAVTLVRDLTDTMYDSRMPPQVDHFTGTDLVVWHIERHWASTMTSDQVLGGAPFRFREDLRRELPVWKNRVMVPVTDHHWKRVASYVEREPHPDYDQAPEESREAFRDMKYGVRVHWGLYSLLEQRGESWPFLAMSPEEKDRYNQLYRNFDPVEFDAEEWMRFFGRAGFKCFAFTTKHHEGFSLFDTKTRVRRRIDWTAPGGPRIEACDLAYSVMESPFGRDIVRELCDAARRHGIRIDLYFSHPDWYDADFRPYNYHPMTCPEGAGLLVEGEYEQNLADPRRSQVLGPPVSDEERECMLARHRAQLVELLSRYGRLDMVCLDQWLGPAVWPHLRETMKILRTLQPQLMFRCRGVGNYGDYYTPEGFVPGSPENTDMPWMVIHALGRSFSYEPDAAAHKGAAWIVRSLLDAVSKGGNFMVGIGPDKRGLWHPEAVRELEEVGRWLEVNGEGIYGTRPRPGELYREGDDVFYTRSKDGRVVYAFSTRRLGSTIVLDTVRPAPGSEVRLLGRREPLAWSPEGAAAVRIELPVGLDALAFGFRMEVRP
jgi:alpha-L-fucosidase